MSPIDPRFHDSQGSSGSRQSSGLLSGDFSRFEIAVWGEKHVSATVGSPGAQDQLSEAVDLGKGTGAAGFMGKMSEVSWIQRAKEHLLAMPLSPDVAIETMQVQYDHHTRDARDSNYFRDDVDLLSIDEDHVSALEMPPPDLSFLLAEACFHAIQGAFAFVHRERFLEALAHFPRKKTGLSHHEIQWLALANLVFALGAKWLQQTNPDGRHTVYNHLEFYARARALGLDHRVVLDHPVLEQIQALGLLAFYLFVNGSIFRCVNPVSCVRNGANTSRSWTVIGHALRHATALGLHLKVADSTISITDRVRRARTWHSLYSLEILVSEVTGRPRAIAISDITTPVDILEAPVRSTAISEHITTQYGPEAGSRRQWLKFLQQERPGSTSILQGTTTLGSLSGVGAGAPASHFTHRIRLCFISHRIGTALYSANENHSWSDLQDRTDILEKELLLWSRNLPPELNVQAPRSPNIDPRSNIELAMYYHSVRMILYRPCLCNIHIPNESPQSKEFDLQTARKCVEAAISMSELMPDLRNAQEGFQLLPWWCLLHYTSQTIAILLLEISLNVVHFPGELERLMFALKHALLYLYRMTSTSKSAYKAWRIFRKVLYKASIEFAGLDIDDVPIDAAQPPNWGEADEDSLKDQDSLAQSPLSDFLQFPHQN